MQGLSHIGSIISNFWRSSMQNEWLPVIRPSFKSDINPVKMAANVYVFNTTDHNLPPLIIMHGLFGSKKSWNHVGIEIAKKTKRKIYVVDARNHGDSPYTREHTSAHMSADIVHLMQMEGIQRTSVMGHSMGGRTMMFFTQHYPHLVEKAILVNASPVSIPPNFETMKRAVRAMKTVKVSSDLSIIKGREVAKFQMKDILHDAATLNYIPRNLKKLKNGRFVWALNVDPLDDYIDNYGDVQQFNMPPQYGPMLFIKGKRSASLKDEDWPKILKIFPDAELEGVDAGHLVHRERSDKFIELVTGFLNR